MTSPPPKPGGAAIGALAPEGVLRAGINLSNTLLVTKIDDDGDPVGVSPALARTLAEALDIPLELISLEGPGEVVDALSLDAFDVGNIAADPSRASDVVFTFPYCEIDATYLVRSESTIASTDEVDRAGIRIVSKERSAYTLWLDRNIRDADLIHADSTEGAFQTFATDGHEVLAGLRPRLVEDSQRVAGSRVLDGRFSSVQQAIGVHQSRDPAGHAYLNEFVEWAITSGLVAAFIDRFGVEGLTVAEPVKG